MTKIFSKPLLALSALVLSIGIFYSCKKDNKRDSGQAKLLSFGPTGAKHGDTIRFIGTNLNLVNEIDFSGQSAVVPKTEFVKQTSDQILAIVPKAAEKGYVTLKTTQGDIISKTQFNINVTSTVAS